MWQRYTVFFMIIFFISGIMTVPAFAYSNAETKVCKDSHVPVERTNGKIVCMTERTAERTVERFGWKILPTHPVNESVESQSGETVPIPDDASNSTTHTPVKAIPIQENNRQELPSTISQIPNPGGYWVPVINRDAFADHFLSVADDETTGQTSTYRDSATIYNTKKGQLEFEHNVTIGQGRSSAVSYLGTDKIFDTKVQIEYVNNFMNEMGFVFDSNDVQPYGDNYYTHYQLRQPYSMIKFSFFTQGMASATDNGIQIKFDGWTNHPELVKFTLDESTAKQIALDFAINNVELNKSHMDGGTCEYIVVEKYPELFSIPIDDLPETLITRMVISGIPYYSISNGSCYFDTGAGHFDFPLIMVDANTGENVFLSYVRDLD